MAESTSRRGWIDTPRRRYLWLLLLSLVLHLVLMTPLGSWLGVMSMLFANVKQPEALPDETLDSVPIELLEETPPGDGPAELPAEDPVEVIDQLVAPESPPGKASKESAKPTPLPKKPSSPKKPKPPKKPPDEAATSKPKADDKGAPTPSASASASSAPTTSPTPSGAPPGEAPMRNPIALQGDVKTPAKAYVGMSIYLDRVRTHPAGKRIETILPLLPQWRDFFADGSLDPVRDFDRIWVVGPSLYNSSQVLALLEYNTDAKRVRKSIDRLVERRGQWVQTQPYPVAHAYADRAERVFAMRKPGLVMVGPPNYEKRMLAFKNPSIPRATGGEALIARTENPHKPFARYGMNIPKSVKYASIKLTPLSGGAVLLELEAGDSSSDAAKSTAAMLERDINAGIDMISGLTSMLSQFGFGGGVKFPRVKLQTKGSRIFSRVTLNRKQVDFLLDRVERHLIGVARMQKLREASSSKAPRGKRKTTTATSQNTGSNKGKASPKTSSSSAKARPK